MNYFYFLTFIILINLSCNSIERSPSELAIYEVGSHVDLEKIKFEPGASISSTKMNKAFKDFGLYTDSLNLLGALFVSEMDSTSIRPFYLVLLESNKEDFNKRLFVTISRNKRRIIDTLSYDHKNWLLERVYSHSSEIEHDGICIEFISNESTKDLVNFTFYNFEVLNTGQIIQAGTGEAGGSIFEKLPANGKYCGYYSHAMDSLLIEFELKDGQIPQTHAYELQLTSHKGCRILYSSIRGIIENNEILFDDESMLKIKLFDTYAVITEKSREFCNEEIIINYKLEKEDKDIIL